MNVVDVRHESLHLQTHQLTDATAPSVGRFPKVLEQLDYEADVWGMLHDFAFERTRGSASNEKAPTYFQQAIETALATFWAFDAGSEPLRSIQIRRLNRYLIWYWQLLRVEQSRSLAEVLQVLAERPWLELGGPQTRLEGARFWYLLDRPPSGQLEIAVVTPSRRMFRFGDSPATPLAELLKAFTTRDSAAVRQSLKGLHDQVHQN